MKLCIRVYSIISGSQSRGPGSREGRKEGGKERKEGSVTDIPTCICYVTQGGGGTADAGASIKNTSPSHRRSLMGPQPASARPRVSRAPN